VPRYLVLGDPVVALGPDTLIPDGALIVDGPEITEAGPREVLAARGPFDRVLGSAGHFVMPGFVNCHYHSELAIARTPCTGAAARWPTPTAPRCSPTPWRPGRR
jgi:cytosine/adenosine deaminase-related metal-dependent hydrolase